MSEGVVASSNPRCATWPIDAQGTAYATVRRSLESDASSKARTLWITRWQEGQITKKSSRLVRAATKRSDKGSLW